MRSAIVSTRSIVTSDISVLDEGARSTSSDNASRAARPAAVPRHIVPGRRGKKIEKQPHAKKKNNPMQRTWGRFFRDDLLTCDSGLLRFDDVAGRSRSDGGRYRTRRTP